jgi:hypothetical protein
LIRLDWNELIVCVKEEAESSKAALAAQVWELTTTNAELQDRQESLAGDVQSLQSSITLLERKVRFYLVFAQRVTMLMPELALHLRNRATGIPSAGYSPTKPNSHPSSTTRRRAFRAQDSQGERRWDRWGRSRQRMGGSQR